MKNILKILPFGFAQIACNSEEVTCNCAEPNNFDSIVNFSIIKDTTYIDVNDEMFAYPKVDTSGNGQLHVQQVVQVSCGYPKFSVTSTHDTLVVSATLDTTRTCVDWTAKFKYEANITIFGLCKYVRFRNSQNLASSKPDTVINK